MPCFTLRFVVSAFLLLVGAFGQPPEARAQAGQTGFPLQALQGQPLALDLSLTQQAGLDRVLLYYRSFGGPYEVEAMTLESGRARLTLPANAVQAPVLELYAEAHFADGRVVRLPEEAPPDEPVRIPVGTPEERAGDARFLSPEPAEALWPDDLAVVVSLYYAGDLVSGAQTRLFLDGADVTAHVQLAGDLLLFDPAATPGLLQPGAHTLRVELYDHAGGFYAATERGFVLRGAAGTAPSPAITAAPPGGGRGTLSSLTGRMELRNEAVRGLTTNYLRGRFEAKGTYGGAALQGYLLLDNQEATQLQPQHRFYAAAEWKNLQLHLGDAYPVFPSLVLRSQRVRGVSASASWRAVGADVTVGQVRRGAEGLVLQDTTFADSLALTRRPTNALHREGLTYTLFQPGTFSRHLLAVRARVGHRQTFQFGLSLLRARDARSSITYGIQPEANLVGATDLFLAFDQRRIRLDAQAALGVRNLDITDGGLSTTDLDSLGERFGEGLIDVVQRYRGVINWLIPINENIFPINPVSRGLPGLAAEATLTANYRRQSLRVNGFRRGTAYRTFGYPFLQTDVAGVAGTYRLRLLGGKATLGLSGEHRADNTTRTKPATTTFTSLGPTLTLRPGPGLPNVTLGYSRYGIATGAAAGAGVPSSFRPVDYLNHRLYGTLSYTFEAGVRHLAVVTGNRLQRQDRIAGVEDLRDLYLHGTLTSFLRPGLEASGGLALSRSQRLGATAYQYVSFELGAAGRFRQDRLRISGSVRPSVGDFERIYLLGSVAYTVRADHQLFLNVHYMHNDAFSNDSVVSLVYQMRLR